MNRYPFLLSSFPEIGIGMKSEVRFKEIQDLLSMNLNRSDLEKVRQLLAPLDLDNIRAFWQGLPLDDRGTMSGKELEEALLVRSSIPSFLIDFLDRYETTADRLRYFPSLYASLFQEASVELKGFLRDYYEFERELRLVLMALRAKKSRRDLLRELQFEDLGDPFVASILAQKDGSDYTPPQEYETVKRLFIENSEEPLKLQRAILQYRLERVEALEERLAPFSIDRILAYVARFLIVEVWNRMDRELGANRIDDLSKG